MTCNNVNVSVGLLIGLAIAAVVVVALSVEALLVAWRLMHRRMSLGWLFVPVVALPADVLCLWLVTNIWALLAGVVAGTTGGKGVCMVFWGQQSVLMLCTAIAIVLAAAIGVRLWRSRSTRLRLGAN